MLRRFRRRRAADAASEAQRARWNQPLPAIIGDEAIAEAQRERLRQLQEYKASEPILRPVQDRAAPIDILGLLLAAMADVIEAARLLDELPRFDDDPLSGEWAQGHARLAMRIGGCGVRLDALAERASTEAPDQGHPAPEIALAPLLAAFEDVIEAMKLLKGLPRFNDNDPRFSEWTSIYARLTILLGGLMLRLRSLMDHASAETAPSERSKQPTPKRSTFWRARHDPRRS
ncbi:hypothetical protein [Candidatus Poriferisodalis sp.]|uniref:hypothetical protein n=1 Tax=Candidatus Poriferisodalis sp. TaxID=3101277 RepID=UPI003B013CD9